MRVYRYIFQRAGRPVGVHEVQNELGLSSPSVAHYHIRKLVVEGFVKEESGGYVTGRLLFENMIVVRRFMIPIQAIYIAFFLSSLFLLLTIFRANPVSPGYAFSILVVCLAMGIFVLDIVRSSCQKNL